MKSLHDFHQMIICPAQQPPSLQLLCNSVTRFSEQFPIRLKQPCSISAANRIRLLLHTRHSPWLCVVCSVWTWCRPWASRKEWAGTRWGEGCTDAPAPSSVWLLHAGPASPEPRIEPEGGSKERRRQNISWCFEYEFILTKVALTSVWISVWLLRSSFVTAYFAWCIHNAFMYLCEYAYRESVIWHQRRFDSFLMNLRSVRLWRTSGQLKQFSGQESGCLPSQHSAVHSGLDQAPPMTLPPFYGGSGGERESDRDSEIY